MYLFINSLDGNKIVLVLIKKGKVFQKLTLLTKQGRSENILKGIDRILKKSRKTLKGLKGIIVASGPGAFTGIRIALSVANTLAWFLKIPAVGVNLAEGKDNNELIKMGLARLAKTKPGQQVMPYYGKEPNITMPKS